MSKPVPRKLLPPAWLKPNPVRAPDLLRVLLCQSVAFLSKEGRHHDPQKLFFYSDGTLGIAPDDHHGYWREDGAVTGLVVAYNYRGASAACFPEVLYLRIPGSDSYLISPAHFDGSDPRRVTTILVPAVDYWLGDRVDAAPPPKKRRRLE